MLQKPNSGKQVSPKPLLLALEILPLTRPLPDDGILLRLHALRLPLLLIFVPPPSQPSFRPDRHIHLRTHFRVLTHTIHHDVRFAQGARHLVPRRPRERMKRQNPGDEVRTELRGREEEDDDLDDGVVADFDVRAEADVGAFEDRFDLGLGQTAAVGAAGAEDEIPG